MAHHTFVMVGLLLIGGAWCTLGINTEKVCTGTRSGIAVTGQDRSIVEQEFRDRYTNCTHVRGNLEIAWFRDPDSDLSFLNSIREVTGYVLISVSYPSVIALKNLSVIWGKELYQKRYSLCVRINYSNDGYSQAGLRELHMPSLHEIIAGDVSIEFNTHLCYIQTIAWTDMRPGIVVEAERNGDKEACATAVCDQSCSGRCWGPGPELCQTLTLNNCSNTCDYRCNGPSPANCCHKACAAGCVGQNNTDCLACRRYTLDDQCVQSCPPRTVYNPETYETEPNPDFRFTDESSCIVQCPENMFEDGENCVTECSLNSMEVGNKCIPCLGTCPKRCNGLQNTEILYAHHFEGDRFKNCTTIVNNIFIAATSLTGDPWIGAAPVTLDMLEIFSTVRVITGYLSVQAYSSELQSLSFFRNLEEIHGRTLFADSPYSLNVYWTSLKSLGLVNLQRIDSGNVMIRFNNQLCFVNNGMWETILQQNDQVVEVRDNKELSSCVSEGEVCDEQCHDIGCWGPGPEQCIRCKYATIGKTCIANCDSDSHYVLSEATEYEPKICEKCDPECAGKCNGPGPSNCTACEHVRDGPFCRQKCPIIKYQSKEDNSCKDCNKICVGGCTGPNINMGHNGCNSCAQVRVNDMDPLVLECMVPNSKCKANEWQEHISEQSTHPLAGYTVCRTCHRKCDGCYGDGPTKCKQCRNFKLNSECVDECGANTFPDDNNVCRTCHPQCQLSCPATTTEATETFYSTTLNQP